MGFNLPVVDPILQFTVLASMALVMLAMVIQWVGKEAEGGLQWLIPLGLLVAMAITSLLTATPIARRLLASRLLTQVP